MGKEHSWQCNHINEDKNMSQRTADRTGRLVRKLSTYAAAGAALATSEATAGIRFTDFGPEGIIFSSLDFDSYSDAEFSVEFSREFERFGCRTNSSGYYYCGTNAAYQTTWRRRLKAVNANRLVGEARLGTVSPLRYGELISDDQAAVSSGLLHGSFSRRDNNGPCEFTACTGAFGPFAHAGRRYIGAAFDLPTGSRHAGWAEVEALEYYDDFGLVRELRLFRTAYETEPGKSIAAGVVPEPPSLVLLAAGAAGLAALRRKRAKHELS